MIMRGVSAVVARFLRALRGLSVCPSGLPERRDHGRSGPNKHRTPRNIPLSAGTGGGSSRGPDFGTAANRRCRRWVGKSSGGRAETWPRTVPISASRVLRSVRSARSLATTRWAARPGRPPPTSVSASVTAMRGSWRSIRCASRPRTAPGPWPVFAGHGSDVGGRTRIRAPIAMGGCREVGVAHRAPG